MTTAALTTPTGERLLRLDVTLERLGGISKSTLYNGIREGTYPRPVKVSARRVGWREKDIDATIAKLNG